jgi:hypothetical protein
MDIRARIARRWILRTPRGSWECVESMPDSDPLITEEKPPSQFHASSTGDCGIHAAVGSGLDRH